MGGQRWEFGISGLERWNGLLEWDTGMPNHCTKPGLVSGSAEQRSELHQQCASGSDVSVLLFFPPYDVNGTPSCKQPGHLADASILVSLRRLKGWSLSTYVEELSQFPTWLYNTL